MIRRKSSRVNGSTKRRNSGMRFDEFGFALRKKKDQAQQHRCHDYSYPQPNSVRVKELCELLSYWNGSSFICRNQIERFVKIGIPPALRGRIWRCLLSIDSVKDNNEFNYQKCLKEVRGPLADMGVSEYSILSAIATLSDTQQEPSNAVQFSPGDVTVLRQIALDLRRSFPTHRSLMGDTPEAIEGQAKLFRILVAYASYNPRIGYTQGMSRLGAVLLMNLPEEEAFWALVSLLENPKYLSGLFDHSLDKIQHLVRVFHVFLKHRSPLVSQHLEDLGVSSLHYVMPWFLTLFTSLPCWDTVLAVWDLIMLQGVTALFRVGLVIVQLLEPRLLHTTDDGVVLPTLLRVPVEVSQYCVLIPALWSTEVQEWEMDCMNSLVLDEADELPPPPAKTVDPHSPTTEKQKDVEEDGGKSTTPEAAETEVDEPTNATARWPVNSTLIRMLRKAQRYLGRAGHGLGRDRRPAPTSQCSPTTSHSHRAQASSVITQTQGRSRRRTQRGSFHHPAAGRGRRATPASQDFHIGVSEPQ